MRAGGIAQQPASDVDPVLFCLKESVCWLDLDSLIDQHIQLLSSAKHQQLPAIPH